MKTTATSAVLFAAPRDVLNVAAPREAARHPPGARPHQKTRRRAAAAPKQRAVPSAEMSLLKRSRTVETALNLFEPSPTTKPKRRRAAKARDVSDDLELGPRRRL